VGHVSVDERRQSQQRNKGKSGTHSVLLVVLLRARPQRGCMRQEAVSMTKSNPPSLLPSMSKQALPGADECDRNGNRNELPFITSLGGGVVVGNGRSRPQQILLIAER
jgi:hypothetical protein